MGSQIVKMSFIGKLSMVILLTGLSLAYSREASIQNRYLQNAPVLSNPSPEDMQAAMQTYQARMNGIWQRHSREVGRATDFYMQRSNSRWGHAFQAIANQNVGTIINALNQSESRMQQDPVWEPLRQAKSRQEIADIDLLLEVLPSTKTVSNDTHDNMIELLKTMQN